MKWIFFDLGATLVDESDVYTSRCEFAIQQLSTNTAEFMNKVHEEAKISPTPIKTAAKVFCRSGTTVWKNFMMQLMMYFPDCTANISSE